MFKKFIFALLFFVFLVLPPIYAVGFTSTDTFTTDSSSGTDAKSFEGRSLAFTIDSSNIMVACYDWYNGNCDENPTYNTCYAANQQDFDDCEAYDSWLTGMGYTTDSTPGTQEMSTANEATACIDARYYKNCDGQGSGNLYGVTQKEYWIYDRRKYDCAGHGPDYYTFDAKGEAEGYEDAYVEKSCDTNKQCSEYDDDEWEYTYNGAIDDPCRWEDGQPCTSYNDCWSVSCGGAKTQYKYICDYDRSDGGDKQDKIYGDACGGDGYVIQDWQYDSGFYCSANYVCDSDHDEIVADNEDPPSPCRKDISESCTQSSDCWNDDGGYGCNLGYCSKCPDAMCTNGEDYSTCPSDCCTYWCFYDDGSEGGDEICHSSCDGYGGCEFYNDDTRDACDGEDGWEVVCATPDSYVTCCRGEPTDCASNQYCSGGSCYSCNTQCNDNCQSSACYETDPDCDSNGNVNGNCGDGICCQETYASCPADCSAQTDLAIVDVIPVQVIPNVDMVKGKSGYVRVIVHNYGPVDATGHVNVTFDGTPLVPVDNATKFVANQTNVSFDFNFTPNITGNKMISANLTVVG